MSKRWKGKLILDLFMNLGLRRFGGTGKSIVCVCIWDVGVHISSGAGVWCHLVLLRYIYIW